MTPATHAAVAAVVASRSRSLGAAVIASFILHFAADALYHFEAFYPLSVIGKWSNGATMLGLFGVLTVLGAPTVVWLAHRDRQVGLFACYAFAMSLAPFDPHPVRQLTWTVLISASWWTFSRAPDMRRWVLCGFVAYLPDVLKRWIPGLMRVHEAIHYDSRLDLGDWVSLLARGRWQMDINQRIFDPMYQIGYALEILLEGAILFGCLYLLVRWRWEKASVADLAAVHHQGGAVHEGSLVGE